MLVGCEFVGELLLMGVLWLMCGVFVMVCGVVWDWCVVEFGVGFVGGLGLDFGVILWLFELYLLFDSVVEVVFVLGVIVFGVCDLFVLCVYFVDVLDGWFMLVVVFCFDGLLVFVVFVVFDFVDVVG